MSEGVYPVPGGGLAVEATEEGVRITIWTANGPGHPGCFIPWQHLHPLMDTLAQVIAHHNPGFPAALAQVLRQP